MILSSYFYKKIDRNAKNNNLLSMFSSIEIDSRKFSDKEITGCAILFLIAEN